MLKLPFRQLLLLSLLVFTYSACDDDDGGTNNPVVGTITDIVNDNPAFSNLAAALERTGLDAALDVPSANITVFAPNDDAFSASGIDLSSVSDDDLANILLYHVISGNLKAADISDGDSEVDSRNATGAGGSNLPIFVNNTGGTISLGGAADNSATVTTADITAVNGTIHIIDDVLLPPTVVDRAVRDGRFSTLLAAATRAGLAGTLSSPGTFTVFAPTDDAFEAAGITDVNAFTPEELSDLLLYHVLGATVPSGDIGGGASYATTLNTTGPDDAPLSLLINNDGSSITINGGATVVVPDVSGNNGVVHAIDTVLMPQDIVGLIANNPDLSTLTSSVTSAGLVPTLQSDGPFTVFAPNDDAFGAALGDTLNPLTLALDDNGMNPALDTVSAILTYHVISGANVRSDALPASAATVNTGELTFAMAGDPMVPVIRTNVTDTTRLQEVNFGTLDIQGTNGVVHIVQEVLIPAGL